MNTTLTERELAYELADTYDVDRDSALEAVGVYLDQIADIDDVTIDIDAITAEQADTVRQAYAAAQSAGYVQALDELAEVRDKLDALDDLQDERARLVRKALTDGARVVDIAEASGLTRGRIYQIRDGRR